MWYSVKSVFSQHVKNEIWNQNSHKAYLSTPTLLVEKLFKRLTFGKNKIHLFIFSHSNISFWTNQFDINKVFRYSNAIHRNLFVNVKYHHWHNFRSTISNLLGSNYNLAVYHAQTTLRYSSVAHMLSFLIQWNKIKRWFHNQYLIKMHNMYEKQHCCCCVPLPEGVMLVGIYGTSFHVGLLSIQLAYNQATLIPSPISDVKDMSSQ